MQAATTEQRGEEHRYARVHGQGLEHAIATRASKVIPYTNGLRVVHNGAVLNHHSFGFPGGTRGVDHVRQVLRLHSALYSLSALCRHVSPFRDRKSTRLNSSHRTISYAVFCLKKKKQNNKK